MSIEKDFIKPARESILFDPIKIGSLNLKNRFLRSSTHDSMQTQDGYITEMAITSLLQLAKGGVGLIITGAANVQRSSRVDYQISIDSDNFIPCLRTLVDRVHSYDVKIAIQLNSYGIAPRAAREDQISLAPSLIDGTPYIIPKHRPMTIEEIEDIIESFGEATRRAKQAGFDAVQIHMGHGYLFSQFLSPFTNRRIDGYGGDLEGRMRIHLETLERAIEKVGGGYPLLVKLGVKDEVEAGGLSLKEGCNVAKALSDIGATAIEVSQGLDVTVFQSKKIPLSIERNRTHIRRDILKKSDEAYYLNW